MGRLTTHVLDVANGCPGGGIRIDLYRVSERQLQWLGNVVTNSDGRCDAPLLEGEGYQSGVYQLHIAAGDYYRGRALAVSVQPFLDVVVLQFGVDASEPHYHVPLLLSPYSYSTYRGS